MMMYNQTFLDVQQLIALILQIPEVRVIVYHCLFNFVVAIAVAAYEGNFAVNKLYEFFGKKMLPFTAMYLAARLAGDAVAGGILPGAIFAAVEAALIADLTDNLARIPALAPVIERIPAVLRGAK